MSITHDTALKRGLIDQQVVLFVRLDGIAYLTGILLDVTETHLILANCTWHRSSGRHNRFMSGEIDSPEREQYPNDMLVHLAKDDVPLIAGPWKGRVNAGSA